MVDGSLISVWNALNFIYKETLHDPQALVPYLSLYPTSIISPITTAIIYTLIIAYLCWFLSLVSRNYSWTDRLWSVNPVLYIYIFCAKDVYKFLNKESGVEYRLVLIFAIILLWGLRLTYNFYRKGGYNYYSEDYRWTFLKSKVPFLAYQVFNIVFIALYQNILLLLITLPAYYIYYYRTQVPVTPFDYAVLGVALVCVIGEAIADQQQWNFQQDKAERIAKKKPVALGFITTGLWKYSRHPNFFFEQMIWSAISISSISVSLAKEHSWISWSCAGSVLLVLLFQGSTTFTEYLTSMKYPEYKKYQLTTSRLVPLLPSKTKVQ